MEPLNNTLKNLKIFSDIECAPIRSVWNKISAG